MPTAHVLIIGLDPQAIPGVDAQAVERGLAYGLERVRGAGYLAEQVLVPLDESALEQIEAAIAGRTWDAVVIGGGIRKPEPLLDFFEAVVNLVHVGAPAARIAFNSTAEAVSKQFSASAPDRGQMARADTWILMATVAGVIIAYLALVKPG